MELPLFAEILLKLKREFADASIGLFNWGEPFLHPQLPEFIELTRQHGFRTSLSTNLNFCPQLEAVIAAHPEQIVVSASGFTQAVYGLTHAEGDIDRVKSHMTRLSRLVKDHNGRTEVQLYYHKYRRNMHERDAMAHFATALGFTFREGWALHQPLESLVEYLDGRGSDEERRFIDNAYALQPVAACKVTRRFIDEDCGHWSRILAINHHGQVKLCCSVFDVERFSMGPFLTLSRDEIYKARMSHPFCVRCRRHGLHVYSLYYTHPSVKELDALAESNLDQVRH